MSTTRPAARDGRPTPTTDVAVVGAGPYGLSVAGELLARGLAVEVFGKPLELWRAHMPTGMRLRSHWWATHLSEPSGAFGFDRFLATSKLKTPYPLPREAFIDYGLWFQAHVVPRLIETYVASVVREDGRFRLTLVDGREWLARQVVMATGLYDFAERPELCPDMPAGAASHVADHPDLRVFRDQAVVVIGAGQSALESAALLAEGGATVHVVSRRPIHWLSPDRDEERGWFERVRAPRNGIAPGWKNLAMERFPYLFFQAPQPRKDRWNASYYLSAGSDWLRPRVVGKVALHESTTVTRVEGTNGRLTVHMSDGRKASAGHIVLATGYRVRLERLTMLAPALRAEIAADQGVPALSSTFESSVPGLYFVGFTSLRAFGPLYRFVAGATPSARRVAATIGGSRWRRPVRAVRHAPALDMIEESGRATEILGKRTA